MKAIEAMITWEFPEGPNAGRVLVIRHAEPDYGRREDIGLQCATGSCDAGWEEMSDRERLLELFSEFNSLTVNGGFDPRTVHYEFMKIDEFREHIQQRF